MTARVIVIIPAFNEARAIGDVIRDIPAGLVEEVVVVNNASTDETETNALRAGATVLREERKGYGWACLRGIEYAASRFCGASGFAQRAAKPSAGSSSTARHVVIFLDGDYSDHPDEMGSLLEPILNGSADFVVGSRLLGRREHGAMLPQALVGNRVACFLMRAIWGARYTDLGPFRAIRYDVLRAIDMQDKTFGWTVEMQIKVVRGGYRYAEVPVSYRRRVGVSKVTGTVAGTLKASARILWTIALYAWADRR